MVKQATVSATSLGTTKSALEGRLEQLESAIENLHMLYELEDSVLYKDLFTAQSIERYKLEATNIKNMLKELENVEM